MPGTTRHATFTSKHIPIHKPTRDTPFTSHITHTHPRRTQVESFGLKWQVIANTLPGRSANAVRNRYFRIITSGGGQVAELQPSATLERGTAADEVEAVVVVAHQILEHEEQQAPNVEWGVYA